jgi:hypothetical protein
MSTLTHIRVSVFLSSQVRSRDVCFTATLYLKLGAEPQTITVGNPHHHYYHYREFLFGYTSEADPNPSQCRGWPVTFIHGVSS